MVETADGMGERRRMKRVAFETEVRLHVGEHEIRVEGSSRDLSQKGVFVATDVPLKEGTECRVEIQLSGMEEPICLFMKGRVARIVPKGVGVEFFEMDLETFTHLRNVVLYNSDNGGGM
ncbi:PilZ domain-containing protein [Desulfobotulus alkaliphilus]|uniref:PilZ domain-containing protein n=1 Tax=Desulfobotulus alkaliphilus TaxID=622671 RepID=A0A562RU27_9BACT|nr:PilZ domain-containing protein [Desulfobotulus alkaliphilus]TWI72433.1 PilZ domain-containing protein [Desulfobotulus alkaliphilus]